MNLAQSCLKVQYELRSAKQVERRMLIDALQTLSASGFDISQYQYTGFGSVYFVDGGYLLHSGSPYILWSGNAGVCVAYDHRFVRDWVDGHSLLEESVEELAPATRFPPIEAEGELV